MVFIICNNTAGPSPSSVAAASEAARGFPSWFSGLGSTALKQQNNLQTSPRVENLEPQHEKGFEVDEL